MSPNGDSGGCVENMVEIEFKDLSYEVSLGFRKGKKRILDGLNGKFTCNKLIGLMGPSGCGKTTLLNVLSGYTEDFSGEIIVNGVERNLETFKKSTCYITQDIYLQSLLTVEEQMDIAADLKLGPTFSPSIKTQIIDDLLETFGISELRGSRICKLSGGEKKRLCVALELINDPKVIFLDEPTTGLDSSLCIQFVNHLKNLTAQGKTVICSIHQASATVFHLFDIIYVMKDGKTVYNGKREDVIPYLESLGVPCPLFNNPADYIIELVNGDIGGNKIDIFFENSSRSIYFENIIEEKYSSNLDLKTFNYPPVSQGHQLKTLLRREYIKAKRNPALTYLRLITSVTNSLVLCTIFWKVGSDASKVWFNYNAILGFVLHLMMPSMMLTILTFPNEVQILKREYFNRWYTLKVFYASITLIDLPISVVYCFISNLIVYTLMDQPPELWRFSMFSSLGFLICVLAQSIGLFVGVVLDVTVGTFVGSLISLPMMMFGGFFITFKDIPSFFSWLTHLSYLKYGIEGMTGAVNGYNRTALDCPENRLCPYKDTQQFMRDMGIEGERFWVDFVVLLVLFLILRTITYYAMKWRVKETKC